MYQPYPGGSQTPEPAQRAAPPAPVIRAVQAMYVGAAASLVGIIIGFLNRAAIRTALRNNNHKLTEHQLNTDYHAVLGAAIVIGLIGVGLWIWMALMCKAGKSWARVLSTVFFGLQTIQLVLGGALTGGGAARLYGLLVWLIGLVAIVFLWQRPSSEYFKGAPRY